MAKSNSKLQTLFAMLMFVSGIQLMSAQQINITGTVTDVTGDPLIGVSVTVPGTKTGAATDVEGNFSLLADSKGKLRFSYVGYETIEVPVNGRKVIN